MKRCPECRRDYYDDSLLYCLDDGEALLDGPAAAEEPVTAVLPQARAGGASNGPVALEQNTVPLSPAAQIPPGINEGTADDPNSIAVLPFVNMSADGDNEYFCDGLAEELLNALAKIDDLKVAARTASFLFRGKNAPMAEIGRTLNVRSILEGSVRKAGNRVRITVQLINAADGYHIWSERYDRDMDDIFEVQDEITLAVVDALKLKLLGSEKKAVLKRHTHNAEAYQHYLRGRYFFYKRTPEGFRKAIEYFERAIDIDNDYVLAVSGLTDSHVFLGYYEMVSPAEAAEKVRPLAKRAIEMDSTLSETNTSFALLTTLYDWDHRGSLKYFERAVAADPKYAFAYHLESAVSAVLGDHERAVAAEQRAIELDPFTPVFNASLGWWYYISGDNDRAIAQCKRTVEIAPNHFFALWVLGLAYARKGAFSESVVALQQALSMDQFEQHVRADLARIFGIMGEAEEAHQILAEFAELAADRYVSPVNLAKVYLGLGDDDKALAYLEIACEEKSVRLPWFLADPVLDHLRENEKLRDIRLRAGLAERSAARSI